MQNRAVNYSPESLNKIAQALAVIVSEQLRDPSSIGGMLSAAFEKMTPQHESEGLSRADERAIQRGMSIEFARDVLRPIGIGIKEFSGSQNQISTGFLLENPSAFVKFLSVLTPAQVEQAGLREPLGELSASIRYLIKAHTQQSPGDRELTSFQFVPALAAQATRLGFGPYASLVLESLGWAREGTLDLRERLRSQYLLAKEGEQNLGPHHWHQNATPQKFTKHWQDAIQLLKDMRSKAPHLVDLEQNVISNLRRAIETVPDKINQLAKHGYYTSYADGQEATVKKLQSALIYMKGELHVLEGRADPFTDVRFPER